MANNFLIILGDLNAHLGKNDGFNYSIHLESNDNGKRLEQLALEEKMTVTNTRFRKKESKLWTYKSDMSDRKTQIDFVLVRRKWTNSVSDIEAYDFYNTIGSDHRLVLVTIKICFRAQKERLPPGPLKKVDWKGLYDILLAYSYVSEVKAHYYNEANVD